MRVRGLLESLQTPVCADGFCSGATCDREPPAEAEIEIARKWLRTSVRPSKTMRRTQTSYGLKHRVEVWARIVGIGEYVSNGAFIVAAMREGYAVERVNDLNAYFNIKATNPLRVP